MATRLITVTIDGVSAEINVDQIKLVTANGTGSTIQPATGTAYSVPESPAAIKALANA